MGAILANPAQRRNVQFEFPAAPSWRLRSGNGRWKEGLQTFSSVKTLPTAGDRTRLVDTMNRPNSYATSSLTRLTKVLPWLGGGGDGVEFARRLPQGDVGG